MPAGRASRTRMTTRAGSSRSTVAACTQGSASRRAGTAAGAAAPSLTAGSVPARPRPLGRVHQRFHVDGRGAALVDDPVRMPFGEARTPRAPSLQARDLDQPAGVIAGGVLEDGARVRVALRLRGEPALARVREPRL